MTQSFHFRGARSSARAALLCLLVACGTAAACSDDDDSTPVAGAGGTTAGQAGKPTQAGGALTAGQAAVGGSVAGSGLALGGVSAGGEAGSAGQEAEIAGAAGWGTTSECTFHTTAVPVDGGAAGAGGAPETDVQQAASRALGSHLTDGEGYALYIFGSDVPGDCDAPPVSGCSGSCLQTWPSFFAGSRRLSDGLSDDDFADFTPVVGSPPQTTFRGWPLYRYVDDTPGSLAGQGIAGLWYVVPVPFFNVMLMKKKLNDTTSVKYISDAAGFALYRSPTDSAPPAGKPARNSCDEACSQAWPPFTLDRFILPSAYAVADFSLFVRADGVLQVAYRGLPLYRSARDRAPGDTLGLAVDGFMLADPGL